MRNTGNPQAYSRNNPSNAQTQKRLVNIINALGGSATRGAIHAELTTQNKNADLLYTWAMLDWAVRLGNVTRTSVTINEKSVALFIVNN